MDSIKKFVVRLLDEADGLLAWAEVYAEPRPQARGASCPWWPMAPSRFPIERDGVAVKMSVHWCDLDVARVERLVGETPVTVGQTFTLNWIQPVWLVPGMRDVPLPAVTERRSITLDVPTGDVTARTH